MINAEERSTRNYPSAEKETTLNDDDAGVSLYEVYQALLRKKWWIFFLPLILAAGSLGGSYLIDPTFTARTSFLPPQQQQSAAAAALSQLGALGALAGGAGSMKSPADQYIALMQSETVADRLVDKFELLKIYGSNFRFEARESLARNVTISAGKKDGLITITVDDKDPKRAANIANQYIEELRRLTNSLALSEAQQRRAFFEDQLQKTRLQLANAQFALQASGFNAGALRAEPKAAAESYARLQAGVTSAEVTLQALRRSLADSAPEVQQQQSLLGSLREQLAKLELSSSDRSAVNADYIGKFREFKYYESLFDLFSRQFEMAKLDESREGALIQVIDRAQIPEWKSKPKRALIAISGALIGLAIAVGWALMGLINTLKPGNTTDRISTAHNY